MDITQFDVMHFYRDLEISARWWKSKRPTIIKTNWVNHDIIFGAWSDTKGEHDFEWYRSDSDKHPEKGWLEIKPILRHICSMSNEEHNLWISLMKRLLYCKELCYI